MSTRKKSARTIPVNSFEEQGQPRRSIRLSPEMTMALERITTKNRVRETTMIQVLLEEALFLWEDYLDERGTLPDAIDLRMEVSTSGRRGHREDRIKAQATVDEFLGAIPEQP
jgi:hypothetical protein